MAPAEKKTFKEKLRGMIVEAELAQAAATREHQQQDARSLAIDLLTAGYPTAFCEFHKLVTSALPGAGTTGAPPGDASLSLDVLRSVQSQLVDFETALANGDRFAEFGACNQLGLFFEQAGSLALAKYFYKQCLTIAEDTGWVDGCIATHLALGLVFSSLGDMEEALAHNCEHLRLSQEAGKADDVDAAQQNLVQVYSKLAEQAAERSDVEGAFNLLQKCLEAATACGDVAAQGATYHQLGLLAQDEQDYEEALEFQQQFLALSSQGASKAAVARAYYSIAECQEALGDTDAAIVALETYMDMTRLASPTAHARACCKFGVLYHNMQKYSQAVMYFEKFFEVARSMGDMRVLDVARFNLGVARGTAWQSEYLKIVDLDVPTLLNWKNLRIPFTEGF